VNAEIRKGKGIESLVRASQVEEVREIEASKNFFIGLHEIFVRGLEMQVPIFEFRSARNILTPNQINKFLQNTMTYENHYAYSETTGLFISQLLQNSYDAGINNFTLNTTQLKDIHYLGREIKGTPEKPINITVIGNIGEVLGNRSQYSRFNIEGSAGKNCGNSSQNATYNITGNTEDRCGSESELSQFNITGSTGYLCGYSSTNSTYKISENTKSHCGDHSTNSTFEIKGNAGDECGNSATNSTFKISGEIGMSSGTLARKTTYQTPNKETLTKLLKDVPEGNKIIFIHPNGTKEVKRDY